MVREKDVYRGEERTGQVGKHAGELRVKTYKYELLRKATYRGFAVLHALSTLPAGAGGLDLLHSRTASVSAIRGRFHSE